MLDLRDGGFLAMPGLLAGLALGVWLAWRDARLRRPLWLGLLVGVLCWSGGHLILQALERSVACRSRRWSTFAGTRSS